MRVLWEDKAQPCVREPGADWLLHWGAEVEKKPNSACCVAGCLHHSSPQSCSSLGSKSTTFKCTSRWWAARLTSGTLLQCFPFPGHNEPLEAVAGRVKRRRRDSHSCGRQVFLLGFWGPRPGLSCRKLPSAAPGAASFQLEKLRPCTRLDNLTLQSLPHTLYEVGGPANLDACQLQEQGTAIPSLTVQHLQKRRKTKTFSVPNIKPPTAMTTFPLYRNEFWLAVTSVIVPNRKAGVLAPHHHNVKNINLGLVTLQFPGALLKMGSKKKSIHIIHAQKSIHSIHAHSPMTWSGKDSEDAGKSCIWGTLHRSAPQSRVSRHMVSGIHQIHATSFAASGKRSFLRCPGTFHTSNILNYLNPQWSLENQHLLADDALDAAACPCSSSGHQPKQKYWRQPLT